MLLLAAHHSYMGFSEQWQHSLTPPYGLEQDEILRIISMKITVRGA